MTTKQIDCVLELSQTLNFSRAAENLFISQPSLTYQVQCLENEVGFRIFERSAKGADFTPAGEQFCQDLRRIRDDLKDAIEHGQNMSSHYKESLNVCLPMRSCLYFLPEIMQRFAEDMPSVNLRLNFIYGSENIDEFLRWDQDILFGREEELSRFSNVCTTHIFDSHLYIIARWDDPLARLEKVTTQDLAGRTFMVGGGSTPEMVIVQKRILTANKLNTINSPNHETTLSNVAAGIGVVLAPGFADDHNGEFAWIPFDCSECIRCVLACHKDDKRVSTCQFIELVQDIYRHNDTVSL